MRSSGTTRWTGKGPSMRGAVEPHGGLGVSQYEEPWWYHTVDWEYPSKRSSDTRLLGANMPSLFDIVFLGEFSPWQTASPPPGSRGE